MVEEKTRLLRSDAVRNNVADTESEAEKIRVLNVISSAGQFGIGWTGFIRITCFLRDRRTREDILSELIDSGQVVQRTMIKEGQGRPEILYLSAQHARR